MRRALRIFFLLLALLGATVLVLKTDNPLSRFKERREAARRGFVPAVEREDTASADLSAYREALRRCEQGADLLELRGVRRCHRCVVDECLEAEGRTYSARPPR